MTWINSAYASTTFLTKFIYPSSCSSASTIRFKDHAYIKWYADIQTHFTVSELHLLHRCFVHPSVSNLSNFLRLTHLEKPLSHKSTTLETIEPHSAQCHRYAKAPRRLKFKLKDNFYFNHNVYADVFYIDKRPLRHVVAEPLTTRSPRHHHL